MTLRYTVSFQGYGHRNMFATLNVVIKQVNLIPGSLPVSPGGKMLSTRIHRCSYRLFTRTRTRTRTRKRFCIVWSLLNSLAGLIIIC